MSRYREQYDRMMRCRKRFKAIRPLSETDPDVRERMMDEALAFFESCLHLRDWVSNDETVPEAVRDDVVRFVKEDDALSLCRDIAIGSKHLSVSRPMTDQSPQVNNTLTATITRYSFPVSWSAGVSPDF